MQGNLSFETSFLVNDITFSTEESAQAEAIACGDDCYYEVSIDEDGKLVQFTHIVSVPDDETETDWLEYALDEEVTL